ncbi:MAG: response regulator [Pseudomonadota bacterium]
MIPERKLGLLDGLSFLIVEDEILIAIAIKEYLSDEGAFIIESATTLARARELMDMSFDAAILDVRLPDGTSYDLAKDLLANGIGVCFHSGHAENEEMETFRNAIFCAKPSTPDDLIKGVLASIDAVSR